METQTFQQTIPLFSIRLIQAHRVFNLIQQNVKDPKPALTTRNIQSFLARFNPDDAQQKASKLMYELNREGVEMKDDKFAASVVKHTKSVELTNDESLNYFYRAVKDVLFLTYEKPSQAYEKWDIDPIITPQAIIDRKSNISIFYNQLQPYIEGMEVFTFQNYLERLNYCLSIISISNNESQIFKVYRTFINPTVLGHISEFLAGIGLLSVNQTNNDLLQNILSQTEDVVRYFDLISHFYSACKYRQLKQKLESTPCLFYHDTFRIITFAMNIPEIKIHRQVAICLSLLSKYIDSFSDWILSSVDSYFLPLLKAVANIKDEQTIYYSQICLKNVIQNFQKKPEAFRKDPNNLRTMDQIQEFCFYLLQSVMSIELQKQCLILIAQILKVCPVSYKHIEKIKVTTKVFQAQIEYQATLVPATLNILEVAICKNLDEITNMIINDPGFLICLQTNISVKESLFYYQFLHIASLLSFKHTTFLLDKQILEKMVKIMFEESNPSIASINSEILLNAVKQGLENEQILEVLYEKFYLFDRIIPFLFKKCFEKNPLTNVFMSIESQNNYLPTYNYFDKQMLLNVFKMLYCLAVGVSRKDKKYAFSRRLNAEIIKSVSNILEDLFKSQNHSLVQIILRQKIRIMNSKKIKMDNDISLYKAISIILDEMTYNSENKPIELLKIIDHQIKSLGENLLKSGIFTLNELEVENIPVYIDLEIEYQQRVFKRKIPHKFELSSFKTYLRTFVVLGTDFKVSDVKDVIVKYGQTNRIIENDVQYRSIVNKALQKRITSFSWAIVDVKLKNRRQDLSSSFVDPYNSSGMRSMRQPNMFTTRMATSRQVPNMTVSRYTPLRENPSEHNQRKSFYSPINFNYTYNRDKSPAFGNSAVNRNR